MPLKQILLVLAIALAIHTKMVYMTELFRHGARYPLHDIWDGKDTKPFHGQLTGMGMRQHYLLGNYLRKDYVEPLGLHSVFDNSQVEVLSDGSQRCVESAYSHMAGWFPLGSGQNIPEGLDPKLLEPPFDQSSFLSQAQSIEEPALFQAYQAIPVKISHSLFQKCPKESKILEDRVAAIAPKVSVLEAEEQLFVQKMKSVFNLSETEANIASMTQLYDTVVCDQNLGRKIPEKFTEKDDKQLNYIQSYLFVLLYAQHAARVFATPFVKAMLSNLEKVIEGKAGNLKMTVISGHDANVAPVLTFLNLTSAQCVQKKFKNHTVTGNCAQPVPFASSIQLELHQKDNEQAEPIQNDPSNYFVKIRYNGDYYRLCGTTSTECAYSTFASRVKAHLVDFQKECGIK